MKQRVAASFLSGTTACCRSTTTTTCAPVVIVGGGPSGLLLSNLLSCNYQVPSILFEAQTTQQRFGHPQAHFLNTRTMEILRHWLPDVYGRVRQAMPPVAHWNSFRFVNSMSSQTKPLAQVVHPVDRPLQANRDANGVLVQQQEQSVDDDTTTRSADLSSCSVGHLAQHTFCRILYDHANEMARKTDGTQLLYGTTVSNIYQRDDDKRMVVETKSGQAVSADLVVAADGAHSMIRQQCCGIPWRGGKQDIIQHLMNIHVRLSDQQASGLHAGGNHAMLYSVFSRHVVAMVVCHSVGEYVIQIPYFPPYQTPEGDFAGEQLHTILQAVFGPAVDTWELVSVRSWTMSSLVADRYYDPRGIALVGDAAHVFPPAGGFGMNTGLQDVHNLAWKVARAFHNGGLRDRRHALLQSYESERRPVAQANAALSVRNYQRLLQVTKSCYLNEQHPALLKEMLDRSPLPLATRQSIFRSLLKTALYPLSWLEQPDSAYTKHIRENLCRVLRAGAGLPLLFPQFEIGFCYSGGVTEGSTSSDTWAGRPKIREGSLLPHADMRILSGGSQYPALSGRSTTLSTSDLSIQLAHSCRPTFVLLCVVGESSGDVVTKDRARAISEETASPVEIAWIVPSPGSDFPDTNDLVLCHRVETNVSFSFFSDEHRQPYSVLVRPDGHVASVLRAGADDDLLAETQ